MALDIVTAGARAEHWLTDDNGNRIDRAAAINEELLALDVVDACDEVERLRVAIAEIHQGLVDVARTDSATALAFTVGVTIRRLEEALRG